MYRSPIIILSFFVAEWRLALTKLVVTDPLGRYRLALTHISTDTHLYTHLWGCYSKWWFFQLVMTHKDAVHAFPRRPAFFVPLYDLCTVFSHEHGSPQNRRGDVRVFNPLSYVSMPWIYLTDYPYDVSPLLATPLVLSATTLCSIKYCAAEMDPLLNFHRSHNWTPVSHRTW